MPCGPPVIPSYAIELASVQAGAPIYSRGFGDRVEALRYLVHKMMLVLKPGAPISHAGEL
jgi:hypothetical protein